MAARYGLLALLFSAACYSPKLTSGSLVCSTTGKPCPDGFYCAAGHCYRNGDRPPVRMPDLGGVQAPDDLGSLGKTKGESCTTGSCGAGLTCVDGVCCTSACTGACEACDVTGSLGDCVAVSGPPHGSRTCNNMGTTCGGTCDGTNHSCTYPPNSVICGAACNGNCDGNGNCSAAGGSCPNGFACGVGGCKTTCSNDMDCQTNFHCAAPNCVRVAESDCLDGVDNNGDGLIDCADPTCMAAVTCVPSIPGDEIGVVAASCTDPHYPSAESYHQGLSSVSCTGCGCSASGNITSSSTFYTASCTSGPAPISGLTDTGTGVCVQIIPPTAYAAFDSGSQSFAAGSPYCNITTQATPGTPMWTTNTNFCAARQSPSAAACPSNQACVAKPASAAKICVRVPSANASCPAGYGTLNGTYYTGFDAPTCNGCTCSASAGSLSSYFTAAAFEAYTTSNCSESFGSQAYLNTGGCTTTYDDSGGNIHNLSGFTVASIRFVEVPRLPSGFFSCTSSATVKSQAQPTGGSTVCCQ